MATKSIRAPITAVAVAALVVGIGATPAAARTIEKIDFEVHDVYVVDDYCGDLEVRIDFNDRGHFVIRPTGPDRLPRFSSTHHGSSTHTNVATGKAFTFTWNYGEMDVNLADNGDGTFTAVYQVPGPERYYGPDGQLLFTSGGTMRIRIVVDDNGTPDDPGDDFVISDEFLGEHGGQPQADFNFCDSFRTLTA